MTPNFWADQHTMASGLLFLFGLTFLPRLTLLLFTTTPFGAWQWIGWFVWPQLVIAMIASSLYWHSNPFLVAMAWLVVASKFITFISSIVSSAREQRRSARRMYRASARPVH